MLFIILIQYKRFYSILFNIWMHSSSPINVSTYSPFQQIQIITSRRGRNSSNSYWTINLRRRSLFTWMRPMLICFAREVTAALSEEIEQEEWMVIVEGPICTSLPQCLSMAWFIGKENGVPSRTRTQTRGTVECCNPVKVATYQTSWLFAITPRATRASWK